jgi:naphthoate synthase
MDWITAKITKISLIKCNGCCQIAFTGDVHNAFRPKTTAELYNAFYDALEDTSIGVYFLLKDLLKDGVYSFAAVAIKTRTSRICER